MAHSRGSFYVTLSVEQLEERDLPSTALWSSESFDQTSTPALPSGWVQWSSNGSNIYSASNALALSGSNSLVTNAASNIAGRAWEQDVLPPNFGVQASIFADSLVPVEIIARGRNLDTNKPTYYAVSVTRGLQIEVSRVVDGVSTSLGKLQTKLYLSGKWIQARLTFEGDKLAIQVMRSDTGQFLDGNGNWAATAATALQVTDGAIREGGQAGVNRDARFAGRVAVDDFGIIPSPGVDTSENFNSIAPGSIPNGWSRWSNDGTAGFGASFTHAVSGGDLSSVGISSDVNRTWENDVLPADVEATAAVFVDSLIPAQIFVRGSQLDSATPSYDAVSITRGTSISLLRVQNGVSSELAQVESKSYISNVWLNVSLIAQGNQLQALVQRADSGQWLNASGDWQVSQTVALDVSDNVLTGPGQAGLARAASYSGTVSFDDFSLKQPSAPALRVQLQTANGGQSLTGTITVAVNVDAANMVRKMEYFVDGQLIASATTRTPEWTIDTRSFSNGPHTLLVRVTDALGNTAEGRLSVTFENKTSDVLPNIPSHYTQIRLAGLAYSGNPMGVFEQQLLKNSIDLVIANPKYLGTIEQTSPNTPKLIYSNASNLYQDLLTDWLAYADSHGVSRELAFYHVAQVTPFVGASSSSQPVNWFWNVELGPTSGTTGYKKLTSEAHQTNATDVPFGAVGQSIYLGYTDSFREININLTSGKQNGWSYRLEYASTVDSNGAPVTWKPLALTSDSTNSLTQSGQMAFDPPKDWITSIIQGSTARLYYVRIATVAGNSTQAPVAKNVLGRDYVNANGKSSGVIPAFDSTADKDGDGYLNDAEYAHRTAGKDARFAYESRLFYPYYGQMRYVTNPSSPAAQAWAADYLQRVLKGEPLANGLFLDNSSGKDPTAGLHLTESSSSYSVDYAAMLATIDRKIAPNWVLANTSDGSSVTDNVVRQVPGTLEESALRAMSSTWQQFNDLANLIAERQNAAPSHYMVIDTLSNGGAETDPRTQIATLASYYQIGNPKTTFLMLWGGESPSSTWSRHWFNALATNVGQPLGSSTLFATGKDPSNTALTYNIYGRSYQNALVLYKPLSYALGKGTGTSDDRTATTHQLNGAYRLLNADGSLGNVISEITLRNGEGAILIKA